MSKHLIRMENEQAVIVQDGWAFIDDDEPLTGDRAVISLTRLLESKEDLAQFKGQLGLVLRAGTKQGEDIRDIQSKLDNLAIIMIEFPVYRNGRGFSSARILRDELGFKGEIRAIGDVLFDQLLFMKRCGINAYEVETSLTLEKFNKATSAFSDGYQPAADSLRGILWNRS
ncbi:DUF934 domain-containing protein [Alphaproteobacteria bacterium]|nr:DUF934 domain-containing protein [Alphaproteobacteria bacterium]